MFLGGDKSRFWRNRSPGAPVDVAWIVSAQGHDQRGAVLLSSPLSTVSPFRHHIGCTLTPGYGFSFVPDQVLACLLEFILPEVFSRAPSAAVDGDQASVCPKNHFAFVLVDARETVKTTNALYMWFLMTGHFSFHCDPAGPLLNGQGVTALRPALFKQELLLLMGSFLFKLFWFLSVLCSLQRSKFIQLVTTLLFIFYRQPSFQVKPKH